MKMTAQQSERHASDRSNAVRQLDNAPPMTSNLIPVTFADTVGHAVPSALHTDSVFTEMSVQLR